MQPVGGSPYPPVQACEMFILELTLRSWNHSEENKRRTLQRNDIAAAITRTDIFDFLVSTSAVLPAPQRADLRCSAALHFGLVLPTALIGQTEMFDCLVSSSRTAVHECC